MATNSQAEFPYPGRPYPGLISPPAMRPLQIPAIGRRLSLGGIWLFLIGVLMFASGFFEWRVQIMGLHMHWCLVPVGLAFPFLVLLRFRQFPTTILLGLIAFLAMYVFSSLGAGTHWGDNFKLVTQVVTIFTVALLVRTRADFVAGALGLSLAIAMLAVHSFRAGDIDTAAGISVIGPKNTYSIFALPAILMAGYICLRREGSYKVVKAVFAACTVLSVVALLLSGNRSGHLGVFMVGVLLLFDRRSKGLLLLGLLTVGIGYALTQIGDTQVVERGYNETIEGKSSDRRRISILWACADIAIQYPITGASPQFLPFAIGRRISGEGGTVGGEQTDICESHNVFGHVGAGAGLICLAAMLYVGWSMVYLRPPDQPTGPLDSEFKDKRKLLRMMLIIWCLRGFFTNEIIYSPSFGMGIGLAVGLCLVREAGQQQRRVVRPLAAAAARWA